MAKTRSNFRISLTGKNYGSTYKSQNEIKQIKSICYSPNKGKYIFHKVLNTAAELLAEVKNYTSYASPKTNEKD